MSFSGRPTRQTLAVEIAIDLRTETDPLLIINACVTHKNWRVSSVSTITNQCRQTIFLLILPYSSEHVICPRARVRKDPVAYLYSYGDGKVFSDIDFIEFDQFKGELWLGSVRHVVETFGSLRLLYGVVQCQSFRFATWNTKFQHNVLS